MTSDQIYGAQPPKTVEEFWLQEIAYQLAVANERNNKPYVPKVTKSELGIKD